MPDGYRQPAIKQIDARAESGDRVLCTSPVDEFEKRVCIG